jgi:hypothetical protein
VDDPASADLATDARNRAFDEIEHVAHKAASYCRSTGEAAFRGDDLEVLVHLKQVKACLVDMIRTYKTYFEAAGEPHDRP